MICVFVYVCVCAYERGEKEKSTREIWRVCSARSPQNSDSSGSTVVHFQCMILFSMVTRDQSFASAFCEAAELVKKERKKRCSMQTFSQADKKKFAWSQQVRNGKAKRHHSRSEVQCQANKIWDTTPNEKGREEGFDSFSSIWRPWLDDTSQRIYKDAVELLQWLVRQIHRAFLSSLSFRLKKLISKNTSIVR